MASAGPARDTVFFGYGPSSLLKIAEIDGPVVLSPNPGKRPRHGAIPVQMLDDSLAPRFKRFEIVWLDPGATPKPGDDAAMFRNGRPERILLVEFLGAEDGYYHARSYDPPLDLLLPKDLWKPMRILPRPAAAAGKS